ncbi:hypothetical protein H4W81_001080 [Nonomuraea africana]|uniref:Uncharacterized protein n=1 Tax=Nonomuraea africana TaxID=46171 RepID=A0ABR9K8G4_9ACTN|nr:hypothetical protein [Nonomuraea africana]
MKSRVSRAVHVDGCLGLPSIEVAMAALTVFPGPPGVCGLYLIFRV